MANLSWIKSVVHWLLAIMMALYLISGFGITEYRTVESLTFGLFTKSLAFKIHDSWPLLLILIILIILHICSSLIFNRKKKTAAGQID